MSELALQFPCGDGVLIGVLHAPQERRNVAVVIVVGGPQYRVGSHRQFVLLARDLEAAGHAVLRFDYRGMGDSSGQPTTFEHVQTDIRAAVDQLQREMPGLRDIVLWGLCDGASASLMYAPLDPRVTGLILLNPWVRSEQGIATTYVKHYYRARLLQLSFWRDLLGGKVRVGSALDEFLQNLRLSLSGRGSIHTAAAGPFTERMRVAIESFRGSLLVITSGRDLTAQEFNEHVAQSPTWRHALARPTASVKSLPEANHTFSTREWRDQVSSWTRDWLDRTYGRE